MSATIEQIKREQQARLAEWRRCQLRAKPTASKVSRA